MSTDQTPPSPRTDPGTVGVILITGIMAAGKSTVAQGVAERLPKSVHLRGDVFRRMIVNDRVEMRPDDNDEATTQLRLRYRLAAAAATMYCAAGFTVVYQDIVLGPLLAEVVQLLSAWPLQVIVLCPSPEAVARREAARAKTGYGVWTVEELDRMLRTETPRVGWWIDTSDLTSSETIDLVLRRRDAATVSDTSS